MRYWSPARRQQHGVALLIALAAVIVILATLAATLALLGSTQRALRSSAICDHQRELLCAGEQLVAAWIRQHGDHAVLPLDQGAIAVADDLLLIGGDKARLQVWLYDALAGVPARAPLGGLQGDLPGAWSALVLPSPSPVGEHEDERDLLDRLPLPAGTTRWPRPASRRIIAWSAPGQPVPEVPRPTPAPATPPSLVEVLSPGSDARVNRNTAPVWLMEALYRQRRLGGLDDALQRRERLEFSPLEDPEGTPGLRLVARSERWHALVKANWNGRQRTWWVEVVGNSQGTRIVQRHDADQ